MKKILFVLMAATALCLASCTPDEPKPTSKLVLTIDGIGEITADTTIYLSETSMDMMTGGRKMEIKGTVTGCDDFDVFLSRSQEGVNDELCAAGSCQAGDQSLSQHFFYEMEDAASVENWFYHYYPAGSESLKVSYKFIGDGVECIFTVIFTPETTE